MRILHFIFVAVVFFGIGSCTQKKQKHEHKTSNFIIKGSIANPVNRYMIAVSENQRDTIQIDESNKFSFNLQLGSPQYVTLLNGTNSLRVFAEPHKNIEVNFSDSDLAKTLEFNGETASENLYLKKKLQVLLDHSIPPTHLYERPVKEFRRLVDSFYVVEKIVLDEHLQAYPNVSPTFVKFEKASLFYDRATKLLEYPKLSSFAGQINEIKYFKFLEKTNLNDSLLWAVFEYRQFLDAYVEYYTHKKIFNDEVREVYPHEATLARMQVITANIENETLKNKMLFKVLARHVKYHGYKNAEMLFKTFEFQCTNGLMKQKLVAPYEKYQELNHGKVAELFTFEDVNGKTLDFSAFKGKYLYIDVWATWCLPCKKEAPFFEEQKKNFAHKNIEFISLSIDKKQSDWKEYLTIKSLTHNQYWVPDFEEFIDMYLIKTIPHFLIINPDGTIKDANAVRPSDNKTDWLELLPQKVEV